MMNGKTSLANTRW